MSDKRDYVIIRKRLEERKKKFLKIISKFRKFTLIERFFEVVKIILKFRKFTLIEHRLIIFKNER